MYDQIESATFTPHRPTTTVLGVTKKKKRRKSYYFLPVLYPSYPIVIPAAEVHARLDRHRRRRSVRGPAEYPPRDLSLATEVLPPVDHGVGRRRARPRSCRRWHLVASCYFRDVIHPGGVGRDSTSRSATHGETGFVCVVYVCQLFLAPRGWVALLAVGTFPDPSYG